MPPVKARKDEISESSRKGVEQSLRTLKNCTVYQDHARFALEQFEPAPWPVNLIYPGGRRLPLKLRAFLDFATPQLKLALSASSGRSRELFSEACARHRWAMMPQHLDEPEQALRARQEGAHLSQHAGVREVAWPKSLPIWP